MECEGIDVANDEEADKKIEAKAFARLLISSIA